MNQQVAHEVSKAGSALTYGGVAMATWLHFINDNAAAIGLLIAIIGLVINIIFKHRTEKIIIANLLHTRKQSYRRSGDIPEALEALRIVDENDT